MYNLSFLGKCVELRIISYTFAHYIERLNTVKNICLTYNLVTMNDICRILENAQRLLEIYKYDGFQSMASINMLPSVEHSKNE